MRVEHLQPSKLLLKHLFSIYHIATKTAEFDTILQKTKRSRMTVSFDKTNPRIIEHLASPDRLSYRQAGK